MITTFLLGGFFGFMIAMWYVAYVGAQIRKKREAQIKKDIQEFEAQFNALEKATRRIPLEITERKFNKRPDGSMVSPWFKKL